MSDDVAGRAANHGDLADLIGPLLDGAFEDRLWSTFLDRLRERTGADYASLIFRPPARTGPTVAHYFSGEQSPPIVARLYRDSLHRRDPLPYGELAEGRAYALGDLLDAGDPAHAAYRRDLLAPSGMNAIRLMRVIEASGVNMWLTISRRKGDFGRDDERLIEGLALYVRSALRSYVALEHERFNASVASEAIRRLNFGWLTLDARGRVIEADVQGERLLAHSEIIRRGPNGRLTSPSVAVDREIADAVRSLAADPRGRPRAMILHRDPWLDMLIVPSHGRSISAGPPPALIAYVHGDSWSSANRSEQIAELFELLPSEARLALALSRGMTIAEAAVELGLTIDTARNYSKKIYAKTGARGQPDLVRFILRSVLAIA